MACECSLDLKLCLAVGTSPIWGFTVTDPDTAGDGVDISNATFEFFVKSIAADADEDAIFSLTSADDEIAIVSAEDGTAQIFNTAEKSELLTAATVYYWSLRVTFESGENRVIRRGRLDAETA